MSNLDTTQSEQLQAIGTYLLQIRQQQSRSLEDIAAKTYIPLRLLKAIEAGQEQILPEPVFIQGFIRRYADALGLDGKDLSQSFPVHRAAPLREVRESEDPSSAMAPVAVMDAPDTRFAPAPHRSAKPPVALLGLLGLVAIGGIAFAVSRPPAPRPALSTQSAAPPVPPAASPTTSAGATGTTDAANTQANSPAASPAAAKPSPAARPPAPVTVDLNITEDAWVEVVVDGSVKVSETLPKGTKRTFAGRNAIEVSTGNAGGVQVSHNQATAKVLGRSGQLADQTYTANPAQ